MLFRENPNDMPWVRESKMVGYRSAGLPRWCVREGWRPSPERGARDARRWKKVFPVGVWRCGSRNRRPRRRAVLFLHPYSRELVMSLPFLPR
jgi:hypothetical protein